MAALSQIGRNQWRIDIFCLPKRNDWPINNNSFLSLSLSHAQRITEKKEISLFGMELSRTTMVACLRQKFYAIEVPMVIAQSQNGSLAHSDAK